MVVSLVYLPVPHLPTNLQYQSVKITDYELYANSIKAEGFRTYWSTVGLPRRAHGDTKTSGTFVFHTMTMPTTNDEYLVWVYKKTINKRSNRGVETLVDHFAVTQPTNEEVLTQLVARTADKDRVMRTE
jgi:hypothetical protein